MQEKDVVERLGPPDQVVDREDSMRARAWKCSTCGVVISGQVPIRVPAPCPSCGGIAFETVREPS